MATPLYHADALAVLPARGDHARDAGEIGLDVHFAPARERRGDVVEAAEPEFQDQPSARMEHAWRIRHDAVVDLETGVAGKQGDVRLEVADLPLQSFAVRDGNVRRVGDEEVESFGSKRL